MDIKHIYMYNSCTKMSTFDLNVSNVFDLMS